MTAPGGGHAAPAFLLEGASYLYPTRHGSFPALRGVDLRVEPGTFTVLLGPNGSGKSTLALLLNAMRHPAEGSVHVFGLDAADRANAWEIRRRVGYIMDNPDNQIVAPTVADDVAFAPENLGLPHEDIVARVDSALHLMGIEELAEREPHLLSEGQKQKVAIAGIMAMGALAIVSDESTSLLDPASRRLVLAQFRQLRDEQGITIVHATHLADEALLADRAVALENGRVIADAAPADILADAALVERLGMETPPLLGVARRLRAAGLGLAEAPSLEQMLEAICP